MTRTARTLEGRTLFITGGSRGIGLEIALAAARDGANVAIAAKTAAPHPKLPGTIYTAADEIRKAGGRALPLICDVRDDAAVAAAVAETVEVFGGIDICINNASAINLSGTLELEMKQYDLVHQINARGAFLVSKLCIPHLQKAENPHILNLSPPLDMRARWFRNHPAYTVSKFGMSMYVLGMSGELEQWGIAVNALWPMTAIDTAAVRNLLGGDQIVAESRKPAIMADAAHIILTRDGRTCTGNFFIDEEVLREEGVTDFSPYSHAPGAPLARDLFVPDSSAERSVSELTDALL